MRKFKKIAVVAVSAVMAVSVPFSFAACTAESGHRHEYAEKYTYNETNHYRKAICEGHGHMFTDNGKHTFEGTVCTVCGYDNTKPIPAEPSGDDTNDPENPDAPSNPDDPSGGDGGDKPSGGDGQEKDPDDNTPGVDPSTPSKPDKPAADPEVITNGVEFIEENCAGDLESSYVEWNYVQGAEWYNVYVKADTESESAWKKLDDELVRQYTKYFRADAVGLEAAKETGTNYTMKVVPVDASGKEMTEKQGSVSKLTVYPHDRAGFAFVGTNGGRVIPGAYNGDGTLKTGARVLYVTEDNMDSVTLDVVTSSKGAVTTAEGLINIFNSYNKGYDTTPLDVRIVGEIDVDNISSPVNAFDKGDLVVSNKRSGAGITIEGIGSDATANGWGIRVKNASMVEIRNLGFINCKSGEGDNIGLQQDNDHVWVHNNDLFYGGPGGDSDQAKGDGALDTKISDYVTHSYNHFYDSGKCNLLGLKPDKEAGNKITYHHNWYDHSDSRHPRIRAATVHVYNNYFDGNSKYGVGSTTGSSVFVENNYFRSTAILRPIMIAGQGTDMSGTKDEQNTFSGEDGGMVKSFGNFIDCPKDKLKLIVCSKDNLLTDFDCYEVSERTEKIPSSVKSVKGGNTYNNFDTSEEMYSYEIDTPAQAKDKTVKWSGRVGGGDISFTFDNEKEDGNYAVIPELKAIVSGYKSLIVSIGKPTGEKS